ncbi:hypothetical protein Tco_0055260, partial [Tanacetum coccineum]
DSRMVIIKHNAVIKTVLTLGIPGFRTWNVVGSSIKDAVRGWLGKRWMVHIGSRFVVVLLEPLMIACWGWVSKDSAMSTAWKYDPVLNSLELSESHVYR